jgi:hypothetical protein
MFWTEGKVVGYLLVILRELGLYLASSHPFVGSCNSFCSTRIVKAHVRVLIFFMTHVEHFMN